MTWHTDATVFGCLGPLGHFGNLTLYGRVGIHMVKSKSIQMQREFVCYYLTPCINNEMFL